VPPDVDQTAGDRPVTRLSFLASSCAEPGESGWLVPGEPGFAAELWARPGDVLDEIWSAADGQTREVHLVVVELAAGHVVRSGEGCRQVRPDDILSGVRDR
jgi:hypothetical protein